MSRLNRQLFKHGNKVVRLVFRAHMLGDAVKHLCNTRMGQCTSYMKWFKALKLYYISISYILCKLQFEMCLYWYRWTGIRTKYAKHLNTQAFYWVCRIKVLMVKKVSSVHLDDHIFDLITTREVYLLLANIWAKNLFWAFVFSGKFTYFYHFLGHRLIIIIQIINWRRYISNHSISKLTTQFQSYFKLVNNL